MAIGLPAGYSTRIHLDIPRDAASSAIEYAFDLLRWKLMSADGGKFIGRVSASVMSWGERIEVTFVGPDDLEIASFCFSPLQVFDWGKNRRNVEVFLQIFEKQAALAKSSKRAELRYLDENGRTPTERALSDPDV